MVTGKKFGMMIMKVDTVIAATQAMQGLLLIKIMKIGNRECCRVSEKEPRETGKRNCNNLDKI